MSDASEKLENKGAAPHPAATKAPAAKAGEPKAEPGTATITVASSESKPQTAPADMKQFIFTPEQYQAQQMAQVQAEVDARDADESDVEGGKYYVGGRMEGGKRVGGRWVDAEGVPIKGMNNEDE
jgi:hypothetical protein